MDEWIEEIDDKGFITEDELIQRFWPGHVQPVTLPPKFTPDGGSGRGKMIVRLASPTDGASIAWTTDADGEAPWKIYSGPIRLKAGATIRAKAIRIGYKESEEVSASFKVN